MILDAKSLSKSPGRVKFSPLIKKCSNGRMPGSSLESAIGGRILRLSESAQIRFHIRRLSGLGFASPQAWISEAGTEVAYIGRDAPGPLPVLKGQEGCKPDNCEVRRTSAGAGGGGSQKSS